MKDCPHSHQELRRRVDRAGRPFYQYQCLNCGSGIGSAVSTSIALADGGTPAPFDESIEAKWWLEADCLPEKRRLMRQQAYAEYQETDAWREKRSQALARDKGVCQGCLSRRATQVHHLSYAHVGDELLFELISVCDDCHELIHAGSTLSDRSSQWGSHDHRLSGVSQMIGSKYSVGVSAAQALTKAGQADWAIVGETHTCAGCRYWLASSPRAREAICAKALATTSLKRPPKVPHDATICKHFSARETKR